MGPKLNKQRWSGLVSILNQEFVQKLVCVIIASISAGHELHI